MRNIKEALKHLLFLKEMHRLTKFNQKPWIDINKDLRT